MITGKYTEITSLGQLNIKIFSGAIKDQSHHLVNTIDSPSLGIFRPHKVCYNACNRLREITGNKKLKEEGMYRASISDLDYGSILMIEPVEGYRIVTKQLLSNYIYIENLARTCFDIHTWEDTNDDLRQASINLKEYNEKVKPLIKNTLIRLVEVTVSSNDWEDRSLSFIFGKMSNKLFHGKYFKAALGVTGLPRNMFVSYDEWDRLPVEEML